MPNLIRIASFFGVTAVYLTLGAKPFFAWWASGAEFHMWAIALQAINPQNGMALSAVSFTVLLFACMSAAAFSLSLVQALLDAAEEASRVLDEFATRIRSRSRDEDISQR